MPLVACRTENSEVQRRSSGAMAPKKSNSSSPRSTTPRSTSKSPRGSVGQYGSGNMSRHPVVPMEAGANFDDMIYGPNGTATFAPMNAVTQLSYMCQILSDTPICCLSDKVDHQQWLKANACCPRFFRDVAVYYRGYSSI